MIKMRFILNNKFNQIDNSKFIKIIYSNKILKTQETHYFLF